MKKIVLDVQEDKLDDFRDLIKKLDYVSISETEDFEKEKETEIKKRLALIESGSMKVRPWSVAQKDIFS